MLVLNSLLIYWFCLLVCECTNFAIIYICMWNCRAHLLILLFIPTEYIILCSRDHRAGRRIKIPKEFMASLLHLLYRTDHASVCACRLVAFFYVPHSIHTKLHRAAVMNVYGLLFCKYIQIFFSSSSQSERGSTYVLWSHTYTHSMNISKCTIYSRAANSFCRATSS